MTRWMLVFVVAGCLTLGCASWREQIDKGSPPDKQPRAADAIREFEEHRDAAQYQAALDRCRQGDFARAESLLTALVARQPERLEARLRLAELQASRGDAAAEPHFVAVLAAQPNHAEAHHAFGLFLDSFGRSAEAHQHLSQAVALDPQNQVFQTTLAAKN